MAPHFTTNLLSPWCKAIGLDINGQCNVTPSSGTAGGEADAGHGGPSAGVKRSQPQYNDVDAPKEKRVEVEYGAITAPPKKKKKRSGSKTPKKKTKA